MNKISCIYKIKSNVNGKIYVGSAVNYIRRIGQHFRYLKNNKHHSIKLQRHCNKYGIQDLSFSIIEPVMFKEDLIKREQFYINSLNPYFNVCKIAGSRLGIKASNETKAKLSISHKGKRQPCSEETKRKIGDANRGRKHSEETRRRISLIQIGNKHSIETIEKRRLANAGFKHSEESKQKMRLISIGRRPTKQCLEKSILAHLGKKASAETKAKMSLAHKGKIGYMKGKKLSEETKLKMSLAQKGKKKSPESILKRTESRKGFVHSQETKNKMSKAWVFRKINELSKKEVV